eukprot:GHRQ01005685.1.p1 GENE.GHRQ01005685.1~~GHRQ01005685.1.p1  ORF type:complete len:493 (+),score=89.17 GHRQ01005685.1:314-1792(+)
MPDGYTTILCISFVIHLHGLGARPTDRNWCSVAAPGPGTGVPPHPRGLCFAQWQAKLYFFSPRLDCTSAVAQVELKWPHASLHIATPALGTLPMALLPTFTLQVGDFTRSSCSCSRSRSSVPGRQAERVLAQAAAFDGCHVPLTMPVKIVGCGSCGVDYLASVAAYPKPDQKLRTDALVVQGGGNCANALTAAARLGLSPTLVTKIGGDGLGDGILRELQRDGIDTSLVLRAAGHPSPFTYIIVDRDGGTRTCIHTPGAPMVRDEMSPTLISQALAGASLVYFDGRLSEAALLLARAARAAGIAVLVEGERLRPGLQDLLKEADYVVTSAHFPQEWTGEQCIGDAMLQVAMRLPRARMVFTTLGSKGSVCLLRQDKQAASAEQCLQEIIEELSNQTTDSSSRSSDGSSPSAGHVCISSSGVAIQPARVASTSAGVRLQFSSSRDSAAAEASAQEAASKAAALNADASSAHRYIGAHHVREVGLGHTVVHGSW